MIKMGKPEVLKSHKPLSPLSISVLLSVWSRTFWTAWNSAQSSLAFGFSLCPLRCGFSLLPVHPSTLSLWTAGSSSLPLPPSLWALRSPPDQCQLLPRERITCPSESDPHIYFLKEHSTQTEHKPNEWMLPIAPCNPSDTICIVVQYKQHL